ncbi:hypothetical protein DUNSADRAFT_1587 [Dunaliella salina]|uniref:Uncharacterized protein n=1 Tax=Dunaliella salina TaxID=3046 RepID=A0ABQ7H8G9_DUNSA|nr:hypothetical protein DUNSADRAFT_1587 [Dunaliella salina]|eukprot:KAF5843160.1 hypothetical protein DUNSADRAFT_1587 [Dunaliella salina]
MQGGFLTKPKRKPDEARAGTSQSEPSDPARPADVSLRLEKSQELLKAPLRTRNQPGGFAQVQRYLGIPYTLDTCKEFLGPRWHALVEQLKDIARVPEEFPEPSHSLKAIDRLLKQAILVEAGDAALSKELKFGSKKIPRFVAYMAEFHVCQALRDAGTLELLRACSKGAVFLRHLVSRDEETCSERDAVLSMASILLCPQHMFMDGSVGLDGQQVKLAPKAEVLQELRTQPEIVLLALERWSVDGEKCEAEAESSVALHFLSPLAWGEDHDDLIKAQLAQLQGFPADQAAFAFGLCLRSKCIRVLELVLQLLRRMAGTSKDVATCVSSDQPSNEQRLLSCVPMLKSEMWTDFVASILTTASLITPDQSSAKARAQSQATQRLIHNIDVIFNFGVVVLPEGIRNAISTPGDKTCIWPDKMLAVYATLKFQEILCSSSNSKQMVLLRALRPPWLSSRAFKADNAIEAIGEVFGCMSLVSLTHKETAESLEVLALLLQSATPVDRANLCTKAADREEIRDIQSTVPTHVLVHDAREKDEMVREMWDLRLEEPGFDESVVLQGMAQGNEISCVWLREQEAMRAALQGAREVLQDYRRTAEEAAARGNRGSSAKKQGGSAKKQGQRAAWPEHKKVCRPPARSPDELPPEASVRACRCSRPGGPGGYYN